LFKQLYGYTTFYFDDKNENYHVIYYPSSPVFSKKLFQSILDEKNPRDKSDRLNNDLFNEKVIEVSNAMKDIFFS